MLRLILIGLLMTLASFALTFSIVNYAYGHDGIKHSHYDIPMVENMECITVKVCGDMFGKHDQVWGLDTTGDCVVNECHMIWFDHGIIHGKEILTINGQCICPDKEGN